MDDLDEIEEGIAAPPLQPGSIATSSSSSLPPSPGSNSLKDTEIEGVERDGARAHAHSPMDVLRWSDDDRKAALVNVDGSGDVGESHLECHKPAALSPKVSPWGDESQSPNISIMSVNSHSPMFVRADADATRRSEPSPASPKPSAHAGKVSSNPETHSETRSNSPKMSPLGDHGSSARCTGSFTPEGKAATLGKSGEVSSAEAWLGNLQVSPRPLHGHGSPSLSAARVKRQSPPDVMMAVSEALLADAEANAVSQVSASRLTAQQRAAMLRHLSPSPTGKSGLAGRQAPERLRIEHSLSPRHRRTPTSRSPSRSPSPSPSRRRAAAATATDLPSPDPRTASPSPRSPRTEVEVLAANSLGASPRSPDAPALSVAVLQDTSGAEVQVVSDAATAVLFVQQVLEGVDNQMLSNLRPISVHHFLSFAKGQSDLPEWLHIYHKLLFDLVNQQLARMGAEEVRRRRGPSLHLASDSLYGAKAPPPVLKADDVRKDLLFRVANICAVGEPQGPCRGPTSAVAKHDEMLQLEASLLETAVENSVLAMEEEWLRCGEEEDAVVLSVVESLFEELVADSAISLLDPAAQLEVLSNLSSLLSSPVRMPHRCLFLCRARLAVISPFLLPSDFEGGFLYAAACCCCATCGRCMST
jgi:hypothetical protein